MNKIITGLAATAVLTNGVLLHEEENAFAQEATMVKELVASENHEALDALAETMTEERLEALIYYISCRT